MRRTEAFALVVAFCAALSACADRATPTSAAPVPDQTVADVPTTRTPAQDAAAQAEPADSDAATPAAARQVVIDYYAAIDARDYTKAYALWSEDGAASGQSYEHFSGGYANTRSVKASVGEPFDEEGAAGSRYIQVPVERKALQQDGSERSYRGRFTLRAVMADGASEEQRHWHLASAEMQRLPE
jgi:ketosteroid isomerase-like protein